MSPPRKFLRRHTKSGRLDTMEILENLTPVLLVLLPALLGLLGVVLGAKLTLRHQEKLASLDRKHRLSVAALEKRLEAHQTAYALWWKLHGALHGSELSQVVYECQEWWKSNCLYLEREARQAFHGAYHAADLHATLLELLRESKTQKNRDAVQENWDIIVGAGPALTRAMELPSISGESPSRINAFGET